MLEQAILYALRHLWESYWFLIVAEAVVVAGLTMLIGSARWWYVRQWRGGALWAGARDDYEAEIRRKDKRIAELENMVTECKHRDYVGSVVRLIEGRR